MSVLETALADTFKAGGWFISHHKHAEIGEIIGSIGDLGKDVYDSIKDDIENHPLETTLTIIAAASIPIIFPALIPAIATGIVGASGSLAGPAGITAIETFLIDRLGVFFGRAAIGALDATAHKIATVVADYAVQYGGEKLTSGLFSIANHIASRFTDQQGVGSLMFVQNPNGSVSLIIPNQSVVTNFINQSSGIFYHNTLIDDGASADVGNYSNDKNRADIYRFIGGNGTLRIDGSNGFSGTISNFDVGDTINLAQVGNLPSAELGQNNHLLIHLQNGSTKALSLSKEESYTGRFFETNMSPTGGANIVLADVSVTPTSPVISENAGSEQFTLTRDGDISGAATLYVSTTDGSTVAGESANGGIISPFVYQPVTFAAGSSTAQVGVGIDDLGLYDGLTNTYGIQVTADQSNSNVLATSQFSVINNDQTSTDSFDYQGVPLVNGPLAGSVVDAEITIKNYKSNLTGTFTNVQKNNNAYISSASLQGDGHAESPNLQSVTFQNGQIENWNLQYSDSSFMSPVEIGTLDIKDGAYGPLNEDYIDPNSGGNSYNGISSYIGSGTSAGTWKKV